MQPEMSEAVRRALQAASARAARSGAAEVQPPDLLWGLLAEEEGRAWSLLIAAGVDPALLRAESEPPAPAAPDGDALPLAESVTRILDEARQLGRSVSAEHALSSECLLLALVQHNEGIRSDLERRGLRPELLESKVMAGAGPPLALEQPLALAEMTERIDAARVLDAAANRAREALRVLEDYTRFSLGDAFLTEQLKTLRHELRQALELLPDELLLQSRETQRDVGTSISTDSERTRQTLGDVVQAACKRLEEALRSLEEFGKLLHPDLAGRLEQLRYRAYTAERALLLGATARQRLGRCRLQVLLTGSLCSAAMDWTIAEAAAAGADMIQLREKELTDRELLGRARDVRRWTRQSNVLFILNDRPDLARLVEADGVHLGQDDLPLHEARRIVGPDMLIGISTHSLDQVRQAVLDGANYIGVGPAFPSATKDFGDFPGLDFVRQAAEETTLPQFVIGGINAQTLPVAVEAGARRIAVSHAVCKADDPRQAVTELRAILESRPGV
jgi:thiamine-phosphate pyrophosphorylase